MSDIMDSIFSDQFMPHGYCFLWRPELVWLHAVADVIIGLAYFAIPITILIILKKRKSTIPFPWVFWMFAAFIFMCGLTHFIELASIWKPAYYIEGFLKVLTAAISLATAIVMFPLIPVLIQKFEDLDKLIKHEKDKQDKKD